MFLLNTVCEEVSHLAHLFLLITLLSLNYTEFIGKKVVLALFPFCYSCLELESLYCWNEQLGGFSL